MVMSFALGCEAAARLSHVSRQQRPGLLSTPCLQLAANSHRPGSRNYFPDLSLYYVQVNMEAL